MGLDLHAAKLLLLAKQEGASFEKTVTLGRQWLHADIWDLESLLDDMNVAIEQENLQRIAEMAPYADGFLMALGAPKVESFDVSSYENATLIHDMNNEIPANHEEQYSLLADFGTLEHIFDFPTAIRNCMRLLQLGGHFLSVTPANNFMGHGFYQFSPELFYRVLSKENGFRIRRMFVSEVRRCAAWYELSDPAELRSRVELVNSFPTYLLVFAQKTAATPTLTTAPQQSDYAQVSWNGQGPVVQKSRDTLHTFLRKTTPNWAKAIRHILSSKMKSPYRSSHYRRMDRLLRRKS